MGDAGPSIDPSVDAGLPGAQTDDGGPFEIDPVVSITVEPAANLLSVNDTEGIRVLGLRASGAISDVSQSSTLVSSNPAVAYFSSGALFAVGVGTTTISAKYRTLTASATITVSELTLVALKANAVAKVEVGDANPLQIIAVYSDMSTADVTRKVTWASSDAKVAWVRAADLIYQGVEFVAPGTVVVTASLGGLSATTTVTVSGPELLSNSINGSRPLMRIGESATLTLVSHYLDGSSAQHFNINWISSDAEALSISSAGAVLAKAPATVVISAVVGNLVVASVTVVVKNVALQSLSVTPANIAIIYPNSAPIAVTAVYADGSTFDVSGSVDWSSDHLTVDHVNPAKVTVSANVSVGTFVLKAILDDVIATTSVTVGAGTPQSIDLGGNLNIPGGVPFALVATAFYPNGSSLVVTPLLTWSVDDPAVLTVDASGVVTGIKGGATTLRATYPGITIPPVVITVGSAKLLVIALSPINLTSFLKDGPYPFTASGLFDDGSAYDLTGHVVWTSSNSQIAVPDTTLDGVGYFIGKGPGTTAVIATVGTISGSTTLTLLP